MGKNKLKKFSEMETIECVFQYPYGVLSREPFPMRGRWRDDFFHNDGPVVLELGCGKGEYTVGLARRYPDRNFIGMDIKGARMWTGACDARDSGLKMWHSSAPTLSCSTAFSRPARLTKSGLPFPTRR